MTLHTRSDTAFGLISHDVAYHLLCDQGTSLPLSPSVPRACFETRWYIASSLSNPIPAKMDGFIDGSGKRESRLTRPERILNDRSAQAQS